MLVIKNKIGTTEIQILSNEDLAALIEPIGDRQRLKIALKNLQQENHVAVEDSQPVLLKLQNLQTIDFDHLPRNFTSTRTPVNIHSGEALRAYPRIGS